MTFYDEVNDLSFTILNDFMCNVKLPDGTCKPISSVFPDVKSVNHRAGYIVMKDGTIKCSLEANTYVGQYDGCLEPSSFY